MSDKIHSELDSYETASAILPYHGLQFSQSSVYITPLDCDQRLRIVYATSRHVRIVMSCHSTVAQVQLFASSKKMTLRQTLKNSVAQTLSKCAAYDQS